MTDVATKTSDAQRRLAVASTDWLGPWREASQPPSEFESVICWARDRKANAYGCHEGFWSQGKWWTVRPGKASFYDVTNWMPFPDGPNGEVYDGGA